MSGDGWESDLSHDLAQVMRLSDQVWAMRAGRCVGGNRRIKDTTGEQSHVGATVRTRSVAEQLAPGLPAVDRRPSW